MPEALTSHLPPPDPSHAARRRGPAARPASVDDSLAEARCLIEQSRQLLRGGNLILKRTLDLTAETRNAIQESTVLLGQSIARLERSRHRSAWGFSDPAAYSSALGQMTEATHDKLRES